MSPVELTETTFEKTITEGILVFAQPGALPAAGLSSVIEGVRGLDMEVVRDQVAAEEAARSPEV
jgi:thioredoxin 1